MKTFVVMGVVLHLLRNWYELMLGLEGGNWFLPLLRVSSEIFLLYYLTSAHFEGVR